VVARGAAEQDVKSAAMAESSVAKFVTTPPRKVIFLPDKLLNLVV
jgi:leucyl-tRNA synthetase